MRKGGCKVKDIWQGIEEVNAQLMELTYEKLKLKVEVNELAKEFGIELKPKYLRK